MLTSLSLSLSLFLRKREFLPDGRVDQFAPELCRMADMACDFLLMAIAGPTKHINASRIQVRDGPFSWQATV